MAPIMLLVLPLSLLLMKRGADLLNMTDNIWFFHPASSGALTLSSSSPSSVPSLSHDVLQCESPSRCTDTSRLISGGFVSLCVCRVDNSFVACMVTCLSTKHVESVSPGITRVHSCQGLWAYALLMLIRMKMKHHMNKCEQLDTPDEPPTLCLWCPFHQTPHVSSSQS